jgi:large subunit ribosomal protein L23
MELTQVIKAPVVTEKSTDAQVKHKYVFNVDLNATKVDVINAIEQSYGVKVVKVNILKILPKTRLAGRGRHITKRRAHKRAIVTIDAKQNLDVNKVKIK